jgi:hypothetical protein
MIIIKSIGVIIIRLPSLNGNNQIYILFYLELKGVTSVTSDQSV